MKNLRKIGSMLVAVIAFLVLGRGLIVQAGAVDISVHSRYSPYAHGYTEELLTVDPAIMSAIPVIGDVDRMMRVELAQQNMQSYRTATPLFVPYVRLGFENPWDLMRLSSEDYLEEPLFDREWYARNFVPFLNLSGGPNGRMYMNAVSSYYDITYAKNGLSGLGCLGVYRHCQETYQYPQNALTSAQMEQARQERDRLAQALRDEIDARQARWQASQHPAEPALVRHKSATAVQTALEQEPVTQMPTEQSTQAPKPAAVRTQASAVPSPSQDYDLPVTDHAHPHDDGVEAPSRLVSTEEAD